MQLLKELDVNGLLVDILGVKDNWVNFRITNKSINDIHTGRMLDSMYTSVKKGLLPMCSVSPANMNYGCQMPANTFIDVKVLFGSFDEGVAKFENGDTLQLQFDNVAKVIVEYQTGSWYVLECKQYYNNNEDISKIIESKCMRLESIEDKLGISIQNISILVSEYSAEKESCLITPCCEIIGEKSESSYPNFSIDVAVYNKLNKIVGFVTNYIYDFLGFKVCAYQSIHIESIEDISKIIFYPSKL